MISLLLKTQDQEQVRVSIAAARHVFILFVLQQQEGRSQGQSWRPLEVKIWKVLARRFINGGMAKHHWLIFPV